MPEYIIYLILITSGVLLCLLCVFVGAFVMFKGKSSLPNENFIGRRSQGEVFSVTDGLDEPPFPETTNKNEEKILERTNKFLKSLGG